jgi:formate dehydrogenase subunit delta
MNTVERLIYMANQIATNLQTDDDPAGAMATHIELFWDPRMKRLIFDHGTTGLSPTAAAAIEQLSKAHANS